jgi:DNA adenine methylase
LAPWIIEHFPPHQVYVEPFGGAASVLVRKAPAPAEVYNDLDGEIVNLFRVLRDPALAADLYALCAMTPYARAELELANEPSHHPVEQARRTLFRAWGSFGSAGATRGRSGMRIYTKPGTRYSSVTESWARMPEAIRGFTDRLRQVLIENRPALEVIDQHDDELTLHYVDPPYLPETRSFDSGRYYRHELTEADHEDLLRHLSRIRGMVVLSGYRSALYDDLLPGWQRREHSAVGSGRYGSVQRLECIWLNPACVDAQSQGRLAI